MPHNGIRSMARFYFPVYREILLYKRAMPNIMIAFPPPHKRTAVFCELLPHSLLIICHYAMFSQWTVLKHSLA